MNKRPKSIRYKKILIKVIKNHTIQWVHFSYVPDYLYDEFLHSTRASTLDFNAYISKWCKEDFDIYLGMNKYEDIYHLKKAINERFELEYEELYGKDKEIYICGWVKMWTIQHMKQEIAIIKNGGKE